MEWVFSLLKSGIVNWVNLFLCLSKININNTYLNLRKSDLYRYDGKVSDVTRMQKYFRKCQTTSNPLLLILWRYLFKREKEK